MGANRVHDGQQLEVWRGAVTPWRCDEMGHMNVRFYLAIAEEGLAALAAALGQPQAFVREATSTLQVRSQHVRYLREARLGDALYATAGVLETGETQVRLLQVIRHADGAPSASVVTTAAHATPAGRAFAWSDRAREAALRLFCELPAYATPRSVDTDPAPPADKALADALGLLCVGRGAATAGECDVFGDMTTAAILGRISDGAGRLLGPLRAAMAQTYPDTSVGSAVLEYRVEVQRRARTGELLELRSGVSRIEEKVMHLTHWLLDPLDGSAYATVRGVVASLDLGARRILAMPPHVRHIGVVAGLA